MSKRFHSAAVILCVSHISRLLIGLSIGPTFVWFLCVTPHGLSRFLSFAPRMSRGLIRFFLLFFTFPTLTRKLPACDADELLRSRDSDSPSHRACVFFADLRFSGVMPCWRPTARG